MKTGKYKKFNRYCGLAKIEHEKEDWFVIYSSTFPSDECELGECVGKGKNENEAMIQAIKTLTKKLKKAETEYQKIIKCCNSLFYNDRPIGKEIILPISSPTSYLENTDENCNAVIMIDENGACAGSA
jgi:hypothetical protein